MAANVSVAGSVSESVLGSVSRSYQYRKVMKPLLERKRRARINKCLDELKQLIIGVVPLDEETLSKLEKADLLELTVHHLHRQRYSADLKSSGNPSSVQLEHFWCGFQQCILEISQLLQRQDMQLNEKFLKTMQQLWPTGPARFWRPW